MAEDLDIDDMMAADAGPEDSHAIFKHAILTDKEVAAAHLKAREQIMAQKRKAAIVAVTAAETERLQREEGLTTGDGTKDEIVPVTIDLPEFCDRIVFNQAAYFQGQTYRLPRHVVESLREVVQNTWRHQDREIDGKDAVAVYRRKANAVLTPLAA